VTASDAEERAPAAVATPAVTRRRMRATLEAVWRCWGDLLALAGAVAVTLLFYAPALGFAFLFDDTFDLTRVEGRGYWSLMTSSEGYSYFRPIPFLIWKLVRDVLGYYPEPLLHALPLAAHALNGWLLYLLLKRLGARSWALLPALLFLSYPFSYQNIAIVGVVFHPLAACGVLATLYLYLVGRTGLEGRVDASPLRARPDSGKGEASTRLLIDDENEAGTGLRDWMRTRRATRYQVGALLTAVVAYWSHESGIVLLPAIVLLEAWLMLQARSWRPSPWLAGQVVLAPLFIIQYLTVEKAPFGENPPREDLHDKALFFAQGFVYPLAAQLRWLKEQLGRAPGLLEITIVSFVLVIGLYLLAGWMRGLRGKALLWPLLVPTLAVTIAVAAAAPSMVRLSWGYVENAPRLLYVVSLGAAIFWGLLPRLDFGRRRVNLAWRVVTVPLLLGVVAQSWWFVHERNEMFAIGSAAVDDVTAIGEEYAGEKILVVNAPSWLAKHEYEYLYGHLGVQVMPSYIGLDRVIYTSSRYLSEVEADSVALDPAGDAGKYPFGPHGWYIDQQQLDQLIREGQTAFVVERFGDGFRTREAGRLLVGRAGERPDAVGELNGNISISSVRAVQHDAAVAVFVSWNVLTSFGIDALTEVQLRNAAGEVVASYLGNALYGVSAPRYWQGGDRIDDVVWFDAVPPGAYTIWVALPVNGTGTYLEPGLIEIGAIDVEAE
jgi:hypothetical protein